METLMGLKNVFIFREIKAEKRFSLEKAIFRACLTLYYVLDIVQTENYVVFFFKRTGTPFSQKILP